MDKLKIDIPIAVEGKYDKQRVSLVADGQIVVTDGFGVFASEEKAMLIRRLAAPRGIIVLTDSDGAGLVIRKFFNRILPKDKIYHLYIPRIEGKERRKREPSKEGMLGVEGMDTEVIYGLLAPFSCGEVKKPSRELKKSELYAMGLSGTDDSAKKRARLCRYLDLPDNMSANALLSAINLLGEAERVEEFLEIEKKDTGAV